MTESVGRNTKSLQLAIALMAAVFVVEVIGGFLSNSLALFGDAAHVFLDFGALSITYLAIRAAQKPSTKEKTFGYHRAEVFAALINSVALIAIGGFLMYKAYGRAIAPQEVKALELGLFAIVGLAVNLFVAMKLRGHEAHDLNMRSAFLHVLGDTLSSVLVIVGAVVIWFTGFTLIDPALTVLIATIIIFGAIKILRETVHILFEGTPARISIEKLEAAIMKVPGVKRVHDVHAWCLSSQVCAMSAHVAVENLEMKEADRLRTAIEREVARFGISHTTIQLELEKR